MQKQLAAGVTPNMLSDQRRAFNKDFVNSGLLKDYSIQAVKAKTATQDFTESLVKQDVGFRRAVASRNMFNDVLREQINLQKMLAVQWSKGPGGTVTADIISPKGVNAEVGKLTSSLRENFKALATNKVGTAEFAQAADVARMRLGLFNEIVASSADNMIKWGKNTQWAGRQLMVGFTVPFAAFAAVAGIAANNVDKEMTRILKVYDTTATDVLNKERELQQVRTQSMGMATEAAKKYGTAVQDTLQVEAELAATGLQGNDLMRSTAEVMRIATLGEMDYQKATEMTIALQTAFKMTTEETTDAMNYMNSVENATSLSLQDFADATPRAASALAGLGVSVKEMGVLLVAMKERGVDATEGANALKSATTRMLNPTNKAVESFGKMGINLNAIADQSQGNLFNALQMMGEEFKRVGLNAYEQQQLIADAFGTYQFNRLNAALQGVTSATGQTGKAMELMGQSTEEAAALAQQEIGRIQDSISGKFKRAVEGLKAELATLGEPFLQVATTVINVVSQILKAFNSLPNGVKMFGLIVAGAMALAGPLIMMTGLMANLIGQVLKMGTSLVMLTTKYKTMTVEQKAQALLSKQNSLLWSQEATSAQLLSAQLGQLTSRFEALAVAQAQANGLPITGFGTPVGPIGTQAPNLKQNASGQYIRQNGTFASAVEIKDFEAAQRAAQNIQQSSAATERHWGGIAAGAAGLGVAATTTASMVAPTNNLVNNLTNAALIAATIGPLAWKGLTGARAKAAFTSMSEGLGRVFGKSGKVGTGATSLFKGIGARIVALGPQLLRLAGPIGALGAAALGIWLKIRHEQKKSEENMRKIGESSKDWAEILGYVRIESGKIKDINGNQVDTIQSMATKLRESNAPLVERLRMMKQLNQESKLLDAVTMEGIKVRQSGGTAAQAKQAMRIALVAAGFTEQEVDVTILPKIKVDMSNQKQVIDEQVALMAKQFDDAMRLKTQQSNWEGFSRFLSGSKDELNTSGREQAHQLANQFWETFNQQDQIGRLKYFNDFQKSMQTQQDKVWGELTENSRKRLEEAGIKNMQQLQQIVVDSYDMDAGDFYNKYTQEQIQAVTMMRSDQRTQVRLAAEAEQELAQQIAKNNGMTDKEIENIRTLNDVRGAGLSMARLTVAEAKANYEQTLKESAARGGLSDAEKLNALNQFRLAAGLQTATSLSQGFGNAVNKNTKTLDQNAAAMEENAKDAEELAEAWNNARKEAMSGAQDQVLQQADRIWNQQADREIEAINARGERRQDALDDAGEAADDRFDARQEAAEKRFDSANKSLDKRFDSRAKALSDRWESVMDSFDKKWDDQREREEAYYDNRIKNIQNAIDAEEKAEQIRQAIFEAEKQRLERMASIANQRIDFNLALNTGNLDEAAKIFNNMQSEQDTWSIDDAGEASATGSEARKEALQKQIDVIETQKEARLKALDDIEEREKKALDDKKEREEAALAAEREREEQRLREEQERFNKSLAAERDRYNKGLQAAREKAAAETKAQVDGHQRALDDRKQKLDAELAVIRAATPKNKAEFDAQIKAIEGAYNRYGVRLKGYGQQWTGYIGYYLTSNINAAAAALKDQIKWKQIAAEITKQFIDGAFGMSLADFSKWVTTGQMPANSVFGKGQALTPGDALAKHRAGERAAFHTGGIVGQSPGGRTGYAGGRSQREVDTRLLRGEGVLNTKATRTLGSEFIQAANAGKLSSGVNDIPGKHAEGLGAAPGMGLVGAMGTGIAGMLSTVSAAALVKAAMGTMASAGGFGPGKAGMYGQVNFDAQQLQNAATIASVGRSMGMNSRDIQIGIMTAITESMLRNISHGDRDSVGLFQQRPSQGWGSIQQIMDPNYAARKFFEGLKGVQGRATMDPWMAAQKVQRSFDSTGGNYRKYWDEAMAIFGGMGNTEIGPGNVMNGPFGPANGVGSRAIQWASARIGDEGWYALCQKFVRMALGAGPGFPSAISAWQGAKHKHGIANPNAVPAGVPVYWSGGQYGHVALSTGNGRIISTDYPKTGRIGAGTIAGLTSAWHKPLLGWTEDINGKRIYGLPGLATGGFTLNDGYAQLHANEAVLTAPLTEQLKSGIQKIDQGVTNGDFILDMRGATISSDVDIEQAVYKALDKRDNKLGKKRKIG